MRACSYPKILKTDSRIIDLSSPMTELKAVTPSSLPNHMLQEPEIHLCLKEQHTEKITKNLHSQKNNI